MYGRVTKYFPDRGFGFILGKDNNSYFVHCSNLDGENLEKGYYVSFKPYQNDRSDYNAKGVIVIESTECYGKRVKSNKKRKAENKSCKRMCQSMNEFSEIANKVYALEQEKAKQKKKVDKLDAQIKVLKDEIAAYMGKRQKNRLENDIYEVLYTPYDRAQFDSKAFIANEKDGEETYKKYCRTITLKRVTVKLAAD